LDSYSRKAFFVSLKQQNVLLWNITS